MTFVVRKGKKLVGVTEISEIEQILLCSLLMKDEINQFNLGSVKHDC